MSRIGQGEEDQEDNPSFLEALENQEITGLESYNIRKNPDYADAFSADVAADLLKGERFLCIFTYKNILMLAL